MITTSTRTTPTVAAILGELGVDDVRCPEFAERAPEGEWPPGVRHLYRAGHSTRGVEVRFEPGCAAVRMVAFANLQDWELGFRIIGAFATDQSAEVEGEDGTAASVAQARDRFLDVFLRETATAFVGLRRLLSENPGQIAHIHGAARDVFVGERCLNELSEDPSGDVVALMERIRRIQFIESEGFEVQRPMGLPASIGVLLSLWTPTKAQAFEVTENVGLSAPSGSLTVPISELPELADNRFHWLDDVWSVAVGGAVVHLRDHRVVKLEGQPHLVEQPLTLLERGRAEQAPDNHLTHGEVL